MGRIYPGNKEVSPNTYTASVSQNIKKLSFPTLGPESRLRGSIEEKGIVVIFSSLNCFHLLAAISESSRVGHM